jgi:hypothetical protein
MVRLIQHDAIFQNRSGFCETSAHPLFARVVAHVREISPNTVLTLTGVIWCCSTSISTEKTGRGLGASHQTGWTPLAARLLENAVENPARIESAPDGNGDGVPDIRRAAGAKFGALVDRSAVPV